MSNVKVGKQEPSIPKFNCWSSDDGDTWFDHPADAQLLQDVGAEKVGDGFEVSAGWRCVTARYKVIKAPNTLNDDFEVECISHCEENKPPAIVEKLKAERDELTEELRLSKLNAGNWHKQFMAAMKERDELAAQVGEMREALSDARLSLYGTPYHLTCVDEALALPDISTGILNRVRAEALMKAADIFESQAIGSANMGSIRALAADMEAGK